LFAIESNGAASCLQGSFAKRFFCGLDALHRPPQRVAFMRIVRLLDKAVTREFKRLIADSREWIGSKFASSQSDFYTNSERRESYGCVVSNMIAKRYHFKVRTLFVVC
jgi:hypothetical protein